MGKSNVNIKTKFDKLNQIQLELHQSFLKLQDQCDHSGDLRYEYCGSGDNYDRSDDDYWIDWHCIDCNKRWTTSQQNSHQLTTLVFPNATQIKV